MATQSKQEAPCRVLIVEDEIAVAIHLEDLLLENGYDVVQIATTIDQALDYLDRYNPDAVLLDLDLRGQRATPIAVALRQKGIPFVLETAQAPDELAGTPFHGAAMVQKPWKEQDVLRALSSIVPERTEYESAQSNVFSFPSDRAPSKGNGTQIVERPDLLKTGHSALEGRLLPLKREKSSAPRSGGLASHSPPLPGTRVDHMDVDAIHGEAAELRLQKRQTVVLKGNKATPGLPEGRPHIGLKQA